MRKDPSIKVLGLASSGTTGSKGGPIQNEPFFAAECHGPPKAPRYACYTLEGDDPRVIYCESQVAQNSRLQWPIRKSILLKVARGYRPQAFWVESRKRPGARGTAIFVLGQGTFAHH